MRTRRELLRDGAVAGAVLLVARRGGAAPNDADGRIARTTSGPVRAGGTNQGILWFKGIPYGADTAKTRFAAPRPPDPWTDVRECSTWGPRAPQVPGARPQRQPGESAPARPPVAYSLPPDQGSESEDCLHLNVWTPALRDGHRRPVMVYIHGGAYSNGTANAELYDGARLARRGNVVVVTVNHRLNLFGYLYLAELGGASFEDSGNAGQLDLVLALKWVRENITEFGGDPSRVLIFGQSGGGAKCATLMAQPAAHGLFHRVITMSGQQVTGATPAHVTERARAVLLALGLKPGANGRFDLSSLKTMPVERLMAATRSGGYYGPVTDGRSLPRDPFAPDASPLSAAVPMMLGNTHDETRLLIGGGQPALFSLTWETLPAALQANGSFLKSGTVSLPVADVVAKYRAWHPLYTASDVFFAVTTDSRSWRGQVIEADRRAADPAAQPHTWVYQVDWRSPVGGGAFGAPHTMDIPFAFDNVRLAPGMVGSTPEEIDRAQAMAEVVCESFLAFARSGVPSNGRIPHWPAFNLEHRSTMIFDLPPRIEDDPRGPERRFLGQVAYVQPGT